MRFLAHSANSIGQPHALRQHLTAVGQLARQAAEYARWASEAELAGRLHDLGKYGDLFQARLRGEEAGLDHWSAGAVIAVTDRSLHALAAALAIEGHHIGLQEAGLTAIRRRLQFVKRPSNHPLGLRLTDADFDRLLSRARADGITFEPPADRIFRPAGQTAGVIATMLDVRMLFSCLVDADFLDTEAHFEADAGGKRYRDPGPELCVAEALAALDRYMQVDVRASSHSSAAVASVRTALWDNASVAAAQLPGLFTLTAPTGSGKTLAMLKFALEHARHHGQRRIVLAVPFLSILDQTAQTYRAVFRDFPPNFVLEHHSLAGVGREQARTDAERDPNERHRRLLSENWDAPIVLTTNVQLLESLFSNRPAACRKLHRLMKSVILFDEAHSIPKDLAVPTLAALSHLAGEYGASIVFATATQPAFDALDGAVAKQAVFGWRPREIVTDNAQMFAALRRYEVQWRRRYSPFSELAKELAERREALCVVNLKKHAQALIDALHDLVDGERLFCLSTNLCPAHRREVLDRVRARLAAGAPCLLVSTQCIEAGVDVDFPIVYRAIGPLEAIAQAAGRCNRNGCLPQPMLGQVIVFDPADEDHETPPVREHWRGRYPTFSYWQATELTRIMLRDRGTLDLNDPKVFRDYYRALFDLSQPEIANRSLSEAIDAMDFPRIAELYRIIDQDAIQIVVPWAGGLAKYEALKEKADNGVDRQWMTQAQPLAVSAYRPAPDHPVWQWLLPVRFRRGGQSDEWFVLDDPKSADPQRRLYDDMLGLRLPDAQRLLIA